MLDENQEDTLNVEKNPTLTGLFRNFLRYLNSDSNLLFKPLWLYSFSLLIICYISAPLFFNASPRIENVFYLKNHVSKPVYIFVVFNSLLLGTSLLMLTWVVNRIVLLRNENKSEPGRILHSVFKKSFRTGLNAYILNFLILYLVYTAVSYLNTYLGKVIVFGDNQVFDVYPLNVEMNWISAYLLPAILFPPLFYFGFSALYMSVRDEIGVSEALKKVYELSSGKMRTILLQSIVVLAIAFLAEELIKEVTYFITGFLSRMNITFFTIITIKKLLSFCILALLQVSAILLFVNVEANPEINSDPSQN